MFLFIFMIYSFFSFFFLKFFFFHKLIFSFFHVLFSLYSFFNYLFISTTFPLKIFFSFPFISPSISSLSSTYLTSFPLIFLQIYLAFILLSSFFLPILDIPYPYNHQRQIIEPAPYFTSSLP